MPPPSPRKYGLNKGTLNHHRPSLGLIRCRFVWMAIIHGAWLQPQKNTCHLSVKGSFHKETSLPIFQIQIILQWTMNPGLVEVDKKRCILRTELSQLHSQIEEIDWGKAWWGSRGMKCTCLNVHMYSVYYTNALLLLHIFHVWWYRHSFDLTCLVHVNVYIFNINTIRLFQKPW